MKKSNVKTIIVFFSFVIGIGSYIVFLISNNHALTTILRNRVIKFLFTRLNFLKISYS